MPNNSIYQEWFKKAGEDERSITAILKENGAPSTACFLSQQIAEKLLKGLLTRHQIHFRKSHDLLELETLLLEKEPEISTIHKDLEILNRYYIETRYPGDYPEFSIADAEEAFVAAKDIKKFVFDKAKADLEETEK